MINRPRKVFFTAAICVLTIASTHFQTAPAFAQGYLLTNPADRKLPWATDANPAIISFQNTQISAGLKAYHLGFLQGNSFGIRENHLNVSFPWLLPYEIALGADLKYFTAGIYHETAGALLFSREVYRGVAIGIKLGFEQRGFNKADFRLVDAADPILQRGVGVMNVNLGFGAYWQTGNVVMGLGIDHATRPDIGLGQQAILPREIVGALGYTIGPVTPTLILRDDGYRYRFGLDLTAVKANTASFRLGFETRMPIKLEASLDLSRDSGLRYAVDLPTEGTRGASAGTQEFVYTHVLGRQPELAQPEVFFTQNKLDILEQTVVRSLPADLHLDELRRFDEIAPDYLAPAGHKSDLLVLVAGPLGEIETTVDKLNRQNRLGAKILAALQKNARLQVILLANEATVEDARELQGLLQRRLGSSDRLRIAELRPAGAPDFSGFRPGSTLTERKSPALSAPEVRINIGVPGKTRRTRSWELVIRNEHGEAIKRFFGTRNLPATLHWDWRDDSGRVAPPGTYTASLSATTTAGNPRQASSTPVQIILTRRTVRLNFSREPEEQTQKVTGAREKLGEL